MCCVSASLQNIQYLTYICGGWGRTVCTHMNNTKKLSLLVHITCKLCVHARLPQSCLTLCNPMDWSLPGSCVHRILQARILEWVVISSTRGSSAPRDQTQVSSNSCLGRRVLLPLRHVESPKNKHYSLTLWIKVMKNSCWTLFFLHYDY